MRGALALVALLAATPARADCPDLPAAARFAMALLERRVPAPFDIATETEAHCAQRKLVAFLAQPWGDVSGIALDAARLPPLQGSLLFANLRARSGATIDIGYAARPAVAPGVLLRIGANGEPVAASPFLALLDLAAFAGRTDAVARIAGNLGLRLGVVGTEAPLPATAPDALLQADGSTIAALPRLGLAAPPADLIADLARDMANEGRPLRRDELVALFADPSPLTPRAGETWRLSIPGLGSAEVNFR
ncbi:hypothetical protein KPL78_21645 [Roseomonas sp. HJA6]|uniref:DUF2125 domain-containing protein n=1 Tax=Roseomonas alba TaxID=2846776 RepID=A0ABS7AE78_9PROT|nr:hypothetical protein [Neoroseomonas alba]MBW6400478.1 hypothetical protein [Neoroseomonas alba]